MNFRMFRDEPRGLIVQSDERLPALDVDDLDVRQIRDNARADCLEKSLLAGKTRGVGGKLAVVSALAIILFERSEDAIAEVSALDRAFHPLDLDDVRSDSDDQQITP